MKELTHTTDESDIKVAILCLTYNHEPYIRDCLEGFVRQKTNFRFVAIVHDDASTDRTANIVREYAEHYPDIIHPIFETKNQYTKASDPLTGILHAAVDATGSKYEALCEGDDFWTDEHKLQKQVDILEADPSLMACVCDSSVADQHGNTITPKRGNVVRGDKDGRYNLRDFFGPPQHQYTTPTIVFRLTHKKEVREKYWHTRNWYLGDWTLWIILHLYGDFYYIDQPMAACRINPTSVTHTCNRVGRAYADFYIRNRVADVLSPEYADIAARLRDTRDAWIHVMHAYKKTGRYLGLLFATCMAAIRCPSLLKKEINRKRLSRRFR